MPLSSYKMRFSFWSCPISSGQVYILQLRNKDVLFILLHFHLLGHHQVLPQNVLVNLRRSLLVCWCLAFSTSQLRPRITPWISTVCAAIYVWLVSSGLWHILVVLIFDWWIFTNVSRLVLGNLHLSSTIDHSCRSGGTCPLCPNPKFLDTGFFLQFPESQLDHQMDWNISPCQFPGSEKKMAAQLRSGAIALPALNRSIGQSASSW